MKSIFYRKKFDERKKRCTFAPLLERKTSQTWLNLRNRGIAQLVAFLVWDQAVVCSSHTAPTPEKMCLTKRHIFFLSLHTAPSVGCAKSIYKWISKQYKSRVDQRIHKFCKHGIDNLSALLWRHVWDECHQHERQQHADESARWTNGLAW